MIRQIPEGVPDHLAARRDRAMRRPGPYWDKDDPAHRETKAEAEAVHAEIEQRRARGEFR